MIADKDDVDELRKRTLGIIELAVRTQFFNEHRQNILTKEGV